MEGRSIMSPGAMSPYVGGPAAAAAAVAGAAANGEDGTRVGTPVKGAVGAGGGTEALRI